MTKMPVTLVEADALAFARDWIAWHREPNGIFHPDAATIYGKSLMKDYAQSHPFRADEIVYLANNGSEEADLALRELIAEYTDRGEELTAVLKAYNIRLISPLRESKKPGPAKAANFLRDLGIMLLVTELMDRFELRPHRNTNRKIGSRRPPSASTVAADALKAGIGIVMDFKGVEKVWDHYLPVLAGTRYAIKSRCFAAGIPAEYLGLFG
jgi:hypothetical protein